MTDLVRLRTSVNLIREVKGLRRRAVKPITRAVWLARVGDRDRRSEIGRSRQLRNGPIAGLSPPATCSPRRALPASGGGSSDHEVLVCSQGPGCSGCRQGQQRVVARRVAEGAAVEHEPVVPR